MNVALIGNLKTNGPIIQSLSVKLTNAGNTVKYPSDKSASDSVDSELAEIFTMIDNSDLTIVIPRSGLSFDHLTTAALAYAKHTKQGGTFIYYD